MGAELVDPVLQRLQRLGHFLLLVEQLLVLRFESVDLLLGRRLAAQSLAGEIVAAQRDSLGGLLVEGVDSVAELVLLQLQLLASCRDLHQGRADFCDLFEHLLVTEVEHLAGVLCLVQRPIGFGLDNVVSTLEKTHPASRGEMAI